MARGDVICQRCGVVAPRTGAMQKYCRECSVIADRERKARWAEKHPKPGTYNPTARSQREGERRQRGERLSAGARRSIGWTSEDDSQEWLVRVAMPFSYALSKNHLFTMSVVGHVFLREEARAARDELCLRLRTMLARAGRVLVPGKVWLDILVQKPNHKGDAVNVVDLVCDAVKDATGVDDRWFSIRCLDWEIVKDTPMLYVGVYQSVTEPHQACAICGRILPLTSFRKGRRECAECCAGLGLRKRRQDRGLPGVQVEVVALEVQT
ncbi:MAG: RusA family crossover junction endodeoxyribonuclease [Anaerolineae bacterium]